MKHGCRIILLHFTSFFLQKRECGAPILSLLVCLSICLVPGIPQASGISYDAAGVYSATTDDNVTIKLYRYRPVPSEPYRTNGTPVLLFPGIVQNMNQYLSCTPDEMIDSYGKMEMPATVADWALAKDTKGNPIYANGQPVLEKYIKADHMRYYSLAHYLWLKGYDPWLANYRDGGRGVTHSSGDNNKTLTTLDTWATLDTSAAIDKVIQITGKRIYIGGHSTGGLVCYAYLQGCYMDYDNQSDKAAVYKAAAEAGYQRHVKGDAALALKRNSQVKGFIGIDPAGRPPLPDILNIDLFWYIMCAKFYIPMDDIAEELVSLIPADTLVTIEQVFFGAINTWDQIYTLGGMENSLFGYLDFWYVKDLDPYMGDLTARYATAGFTVRCFGQYMDNGLHETTREFWKNGLENQNLVRGPEPDPGNDGYYYYSDHMDRITVPMIACLSDSGSLVAPLTVYEDIISKKTPNALDEWYTITDTAHFDVAAGRKSPGEVFPKIGAWLDKVEAVEADTSQADASDGTESDTEKNASKAATDSSGEGSSGGGCFIVSARF
ncbi:MAG: hypothetical protein ABFD81_05325 [Syntrophaceae bacterium]